jgi:hypothetical protein
MTISGTPFSLEPSILSSAVEKHKNWNIQDYNFVCGSVWLWNLDFDTKGGTQTEGVWEQDAEEDIWTEEGWGNGSVKKTA